jgi:hypothetical protein
LTCLHDSEHNIRTPASAGFSHKGPLVPLLKPDTTRRSAVIAICNSLLANEHRPFFIDFSFICNGSNGASTCGSACHRLESQKSFGKYSALLCLSHAPDAKQHELRMFYACKNFNCSVCVYTPAFFISCKMSHWWMSLAADLIKSSRRRI